MSDLNKTKAELPIYYTFLRSCTNFREFANAEKIVQDTDLTYNEAKEQCQEYNRNLSEQEKENGTKMEFTTDV